MIWCWELVSSWELSRLVFRVVNTLWFEFDLRRSEQNRLCELAGYRSFTTFGEATRCSIGFSTSWRGPREATRY
jgi:hypothetical protein